MSALVRIRSACLARALEGERDAELVLQYAEGLFTMVFSAAQLIETGSRSERSEAVLRLIDIAEVETPDLIDCVVGAARRAIRAIAAERAWPDRRVTAVEARAARALRDLERTLEALAPA